MHNWVVIFSLIAIWFTIGIKVCRTDSKAKNKSEQERTEAFRKFIQSNAWNIIANLKPLPYSPEEYDTDCGSEN